MGIGVFIGLVNVFIFYALSVLGSWTMLLSLPRCTGLVIANTRS